MKRYAFAFAGLFLAFSVTGCAATSFYSTEKTAVHPEVRPDQALIYVIRPDPDAFLTPNAFEDVYVDNDGNRAGVTRGKTYFFFFTEPGEHLITSKVGKNRSELKLTVAAGETYYIKQSVRIGYFQTRNELSILNSEEAQKEIEKCRYIREATRSEVMARELANVIFVVVASAVLGNVLIWCCFSL